MHNHFKEEEKDKINIFINLALEFNRTHNIFSREGHDEVYKKDILDCEPLIKRIKNNTNTRKIPIDNIQRKLFSVYPPPTIRKSCNY